MLNVPDYAEVMDIREKEFDLATIFKRKEQKQDLDKVEKKEELSQKDKKTKERPLWTKIKGLFKKKK